MCQVLLVFKNTVFYKHEGEKMKAAWDLGRERAEHQSIKESLG
jgi:hypothetical protein